MVPTRCQGRAWPAARGGRRRQVLPGRPAYPGEPSRVWATDMAPDCMVMDCRGWWATETTDVVEQGGGAPSASPRRGTPIRSAARPPSAFIPARTADMDTFDIGGDLTVRRLCYFAMPSRARISSASRPTRGRPRRAPPGRRHGRFRRHRVRFSPGETICDYSREVTV
jgi:hypothetical protein